MKKAVASQQQGTSTLLQGSLAIDAQSDEAETKAEINRRFKKILLSQVFLLGT